MPYQTQGYDRGAALGPGFVSRTVAPEMSQVAALEQQFAMTTDPAEKIRLRKLIALEEAKAREMAAAQNVVQQQAASPGASYIFGGDAERIQRNMMMDAIRRKYAGGGF